jgi:hypothetical protein
MISSGRIITGREIRKEGFFARGQREQTTPTNYKSIPVKKISKEGSGLFF